MKKVYITIKELPEIRIGSLVRQKQDKPDSNYEVINSDDLLHDDQGDCTYSQHVVERGTDFFREVTEREWNKIIHLSIQQVLNMKIKKAKKKK